MIDRLEELKGLYLRTEFLHQKPAEMIPVGSESGQLVNVYQLASESNT